MNGRDTQNKTGKDRRINENNTTCKVGGECGCKDGQRTGCDTTDCNCSEGRSTNPGTKKPGAKGGVGGNVLRPKGPSGVRDEEARSIIVKELRSVADGIENGTIRVIEAKSNRVTNEKTKQVGYLMQILYLPTAPVEMITNAEESCSNQ